MVLARPASRPVAPAFSPARAAPAAKAPRAGPGRAFARFFACPGASAVGFGVAALIAWAVTAGGLFETLLGGRGRYMEDVAGAMLFGIPWALAAIFGAYGYRIPARPWHNAAAIAGIVLWAVVLIGVLASAVLYALDLTD